MIRKDEVITRGKRKIIPLELIRRRHSDEDVESLMEELIGYVTEVLSDDGDEGVYVRDYQRWRNLHYV